MSAVTCMNTAYTQSATASARAFSACSFFADKMTSNSNNASFADTVLFAVSAIFVLALTVALCVLSVSVVIFAIIIIISISIISRVIISTYRKTANMICETNG